MGGKPCTVYRFSVISLPATILVGGDWGPENDPHAHPYRVDIRLSAERLDHHGYLIDLDVLEQIIDACVDAYRDRLLNDLPEFDQINPSIEHFCRRFFERFTTALGSNRFNRVAVRIWENEQAWAAYEESF
jgi:6-pyruvoyltetrahydropterin/6-carboxytetrahydropterin synthase